jgi:hypothetical protein
VSEKPRDKFKRIDVENLNIVDKDGNVKMTLFNPENVPSLIFEGKDILPGHRKDWPVSGITFYNGEGDECGGLVFGSAKKDDGQYESFGSLSFDQYKQDQVVTFSYNNENGNMNYGLTICDRPKVPLPLILDKIQEIQESNLSDEAKEKEKSALWEGSTTRAFMGKNENGEVTVRLMDSRGKPRIRMLIDADDNPIMEFLDAQGNVIYSIPPQQ